MFVRVSRVESVEAATIDSAGRTVLWMFQRLEGVVMVAALVVILASVLKHSENVMLYQSLGLRPRDRHHLERLLCSGIVPVS